MTDPDELDQGKSHFITLTINLSILDNDILREAKSICQALHSKTLEVAVPRSAKAHVSVDKNDSKHQQKPEKDGSINADYLIFAKICPQLAIDKSYPIIDWHDDSHYMLTEEDYEFAAS